MMVAEATFMPVLMLFFIIAEMDIATAAMHDRTRTDAARVAAGLVREGNIGAGMERRVDWSASIAGIPRAVKFSRCGFGPCAG